MVDRTRRQLLDGAAFSLAALALPAGAPAAEVPAKKLRILILGGTGFTGPHQVRYALARGHEVTLFNRGRQPQEWPGHVEELIGDRNGDLKALEGREWDVCIDNPTTLPVWVRDAGRVLAGKVKQYVFISTISVYARNDKPADETDALAAYKGKDPLAETLDTFRGHLELYGPLKAASEAEAKRQFGEAVTIIRPGLIVGPGDETDRFSYWPVRLANPGHRWGDTVLAPGDGADPVQFIDARDLAEWTIRMCESRTFGVLNGTGPARPLTMKAMIEGIATGVRARPNIQWAPAKWLEDNRVSAWGDMPVWVPSEGDTFGFSRRDNRRALKAGLTFRPLPITAADTLAWFLKQPPDRQAKLRSGLAAEREAALLAKLT
ncbi:MAG: NAD-dependent epimerase/dehydratase family protein [Phenylobacterium sp.]